MPRGRGKHKVSVRDVTRAEDPGPRLRLDDLIADAYPNVAIEYVEALILAAMDVIRRCTAAATRDFEKSESACRRIRGLSHKLLAKDPVVSVSLSSSKPVRWKRWIRCHGNHPVLMRLIGTEGRRRRGLRSSPMAAKLALKLSGEPPRGADRALAAVSGAALPESS
jgi:hypothetical protein